MAATHEPRDKHQKDDWHRGDDNNDEIVAAKGHAQQPSPMNQPDIMVGPEPEGQPSPRRAALPQSVDVWQ